MTNTRPICILCNKRLADKCWTSKSGKVAYRKICSLCRKQTSKTYQAIKGTPFEHLKGARKRALLLITPHVCSRCGFVPEHICQIHVDHIDGHGENNDPSNWQLLCANCHELKTQQNGDRRKPRKLPDST